jgi:thioredoxin reductase (NADPH)
MVSKVPPITSKVLIIGAGPAGYTAAIYAARANLSPLLIQGLQPGGQLTITSEVENFPGFAKAVQGPWLMEQMQAQAEHVGTRLIQDVVVGVDFSRRPFRAIGDSGQEYLGATAIIATGAKARWLGVRGEERFQGAGVSACATCDGFFFRGRNVAVIGGGNTAVEEALYLTNHARMVTLIHRRDQLRAERIMQERLFRHPKIRVIWNSVVEEIKGQDDPPGVSRLRLKNTLTGLETDLEVEGVFVAIGHDPATSLFKGVLPMDDDGYLLTKPDSTATNVPGIFAAGDVKDKIFRQAVTAAGMGCMAALEAERFLAEHSGEALEG